MDSVAVYVSDQVGVTLARREARKIARALAFDALAVEQIALCVSELGNNLWLHAGSGTLTLAPLTEPQLGLLIRTDDEGPGIENVARAMAEGFSSRGGLGSGLAAVRRLMDKLIIVSEPGVGTRVEAVKWCS